MWNNNTTGVVLLIWWYHISGGILYPFTIVPSNKQAHNVWDSLFITFIKSRVHGRKQHCTIQKSYQTFFSASTIAWKLLAARCNALSAWFLFQNDANLYLTLPEHGKWKMLSIHKHSFNVGISTTISSCYWTASYCPIYIL